jgi:exopolysaccharide biosynthesis polyprenyl glycosylphosphotransferase
MAVTALVADSHYAVVATAGSALPLLGFRLGLWSFIAPARRRGMGLQSTFVIGTTLEVAQIKHRMSTFPECGLRYSGELVTDADQAVVPPGTIAELLAAHDVEHVLCFVHDVDDPIFRGLMLLSNRDLGVSVVLPLARLYSAHSPAHIGDLGVVPVKLRPALGAGIAKRAFDIVASALLILLLSPVMAATALAVRIGDPGPAIFRQKRTGKDNQPFTIYKFRSMVQDAETLRQRILDQNVNDGLLFKVDHDPRITRVGAVIRRFSIDELPQLFNVMKGDMSLVGPRPLPVESDEFDETARIRHQVLPGITGLWQINGANALSYADMLELDLTYVATRSLGLDLGVLLQTLPAVTVRRSPY